MFEINVLLGKFSLELGNVLKEYPNIAFLILILSILSFVISLIDKLKHVVTIEPKLSRLIELRQKVEDKDKRLMNFMDLQIQSELFKECTGYFKCAINEQVIDFYISNSDRYSWRQIRLIQSEFEIVGDQLKLKPKTRFTWLVDLVGYVYYGLFALLSILLAFTLLILKIQFFIYIIPLFAVFGLSGWMALRDADKARIYNKMLLEPSLKPEVKNKPKVDIP